MSGGPSCRACRRCSSCTLFVLTQTTIHVVHVCLAVTCGKCNYDKAYFREVQTRSADEAATLFFTCVKCGYVLQSQSQSQCPPYPLSDLDVEECAAKKNFIDNAVPTLFLPCLQAPLEG